MILTVTATGGKFELRITPGDPGLLFEPDHSGFVGLASTMEVLGTKDVLILSEVEVPEISGLPRDLDAREFIRAAHALSKLGLRSSPGGDA